MFASPRSKGSLAVDENSEQLEISKLKQKQASVSTRRKETAKNFEQDTRALRDKTNSPSPAPSPKSTATRKPVPGSSTPQSRVVSPSPTRKAKSTPGKRDSASQIQALEAQVRQLTACNNDLTEQVSRHAKALEDSEAYEQVLLKNEEGHRKAQAAVEADVTALLRSRDQTEQDLRAARAELEATKQYLRSAKQEAEKSTNGLEGKQSDVSSASGAVHVEAAVISRIEKLVQKEDELSQLVKGLEAKKQSVAESLASHGVRTEKLESPLDALLVPFTDLRTQLADAKAALHNSEDAKRAMQKDLDAMYHMMDQNRISLEKLKAASRKEVEDAQRHYELELRRSHECVTELEEQLTLAAKRREELEAQLASTATAHAELATSQAQLQSEIQRLSGELSLSNSSLRAVQFQYDELSHSLSVERSKSAEEIESVRSLLAETNEQLQAEAIKCVDLESALAASQMRLAETEMARQQLSDSYAAEREHAQQQTTEFDQTVEDLGAALSTLRLQLEQSAAERKDLLDEVETLQSRLFSQTQATAAVEVQTASLQQQIATLEQQLADVSASRSLLQFQLEESGLERSAGLKREAELQAKIAGFQKQRSEESSLIQEQLAQALSQVDLNASREAEMRSKVSVAEAAASAFSLELERLIETYAQQAQAWADQLQQSRKQCQDAEQGRRETDVALSAVRSDLACAAAEIVSLSTRGAELTATVTSLEHSVESSAAEQRRLATELELASGRERELCDAKQQLAQLEEAVQTLKAELAELLEEQHASANRLAAEVRCREQEVQQLLAERDTLLKEIGVLSKQLTAADAALVSEQTRLVSSYDRVSHLEAEVQRLANELSATEDKHLEDAEAVSSVHLAYSRGSGDSELHRALDACQELDCALAAAELEGYRHEVTAEQPPQDRLRMSELVDERQALLSKVSQLEAESDNLRKKLRAPVSQTASILVERDDLKTQLDNSKAENSRLSEQLAALRDEIQSLEKRLTSSMKDNNKLSASVEHLQRKLVAAYSQLTAANAATECLRASIRSDSSLRDEAVAECHEAEEAAENLLASQAALAEANEWLSSAADSLQHEMQTVSGQLETQKRIIAAVFEGLRQETLEKEKAKSSSDMLRKQLHSIEEVSDLTKLLQNEVNELESKLETALQQHRDSMAILNERLKQERASKDELQTRLDNSQARLDDQVFLNQDLKSRLEELASLREIQSSQLYNVVSQLNTVLQPPSPADGQDELRHSNQHVQQLQEQLQAAKNEIYMLECVIGDYDRRTQIEREMLRVRDAQVKELTVEVARQAQLLQNQQQQLERMTFDLSNTAKALAFIVPLLETPENEDAISTNPSSSAIHPEESASSVPVGVRVGLRLLAHQNMKEDVPSGRVSVLASRAVESMMVSVLASSAVESMLATMQALLRDNQALSLGKRRLYDEIQMLQGKIHALDEANRVIRAIDGFYTAPLSKPVTAELVAESATETAPPSACSSPNKLSHPKESSPLLGKQVKKKQGHWCSIL